MSATEAAVVLHMVQLWYDHQRDPASSKDRGEDRAAVSGMAASLPKRIRDRLRWLGDVLESGESMKIMPVIPVNPDVSEDFLASMIRKSCQVHTLPESGPVAIDFDNTLSYYADGSPLWPGIALAHRCQRKKMPWSIVTARWERWQAKEEILKFCLTYGLTPDDIIFTNLEQKGPLLERGGFTALYDDRDIDLASARAYNIEAHYVPRSFLPDIQETTC